MLKLDKSDWLWSSILAVGCLLLAASFCGCEQNPAAAAEYARVSHEGQVARCRNLCQTADGFNWHEQANWCSCFYMNPGRIHPCMEKSQ